MKTETIQFNRIAGDLDTTTRKAVMEAMWAGQAEIINDATQHTTIVAPDAVLVEGEHLFYVSFPGATRDRIPTQHYMIPAPDDRTAVARAHKLYVLEPRHRKGSSLRVTVMQPPTLRGAPRR